MKIIVIAAVAKNLAIGKNNMLLWKLSDDMQFFKNTTSGFPIITGRKNYESIPPKFRPLPNRTNIIITRDKNHKAEGAIVTFSLEEALAEAKKLNAEKCFIIGGGEIYKQALENDLVNEMYISHVNENFEADTYFPIIVNENWNAKDLQHFNANDKNQYSFTIKHYSRK